jgi:hypothetical protein
MAEYSIKLVTKEVEMKIVLKLVTVPLLTVFAIACSSCVIADNDKASPSEGKGKGRTWVVYESDAKHMVKADKFQVRSYGNKHKLVALSSLRTNWGRPHLDQFSVDLIYVPDDERYCGFINIPGHDKASHDQSHAFAIKMKAPNVDILNISWFPHKIKGLSDLSDKEKLEICREITFSHHGGFAHAEPD